MLAILLFALAIACMIAKGCISSESTGYINNNYETV